MSDPVPATSYDEYPYPSLSYSLTHPERFATVATLFGLKPAGVEKCRYLDIGCAVGGNLIPLAYSMPESEFTGIDYAAQQIEIGREHVTELGLENIRLDQMDIMDIPEDFGQFDYIMAHGIYSWVPENVRDRLLAVIRRHLAPNGIGYISYNCYPGWHMLDMAREMMLYRIRDISDPSERVAKAKELIDILVDSGHEDNKLFGAFLESYKTTLTDKLSQWDFGGNSLMLHDELSEVNEPVYFHEFAKHAGKHGLQYLSEVDIYQVSPARYPKDAIQAMGRMAKDNIDFEQYLDFQQNRTFRRTLVCHQEATVTRRLRPESVNSLYISSYAESVSKAPDVKGATIEQFKGKDGAIFSTDHPLSKAALLYLSKHAPSLVTFDELVAATAPEVGISGEEKLTTEARVLAANILRAYSYSESLVQVHVFRPSFVTHVSKRPLATPVARWQADRFSKVTSMRHERVELDRVSRRIFMQLDGQHDRETISEHLLQLIEEGTITLNEEEKKDIGSRSIAEVVAREVDHNLMFFAWASLLIG
jgi:methyltransferase-like protein/SAM-dependent methyltransferase